MKDHEEAVQRVRGRSNKPTALPPKGRPMRSEKGYVLIIAVLVLAAAGIPFAIANRSFFLTAGRDRELETKEEIELIVGAIRGNPRLRTFGYIGDMGRLPNTLSEINTKGAQVAFHNEDSGVRHFMSVGMGWNGVYVPEFFQDSYLEDAWGNDYVYTIETVAVDHDNDPSTATVDWRRARIKSNGPDHTASTDDDITSENIWESGAMYISARKSGDFPSLPGWADSTLYSATNGEQTSSLLEGGGGSISYTDGSGNTFDVHAFSTVNHGPHAYELARAGQGAGKKNEQGVFNSQGGILKLIIVPIPE